MQVNKIEILETGERIITIAGEEASPYCYEGEELAELLQQPIYDTTLAQLNVQEVVDALGAIPITIQPVIAQEEQQPDNEFVL